MPAYVALLRGVNVGKSNRVPMADWRAQLEGLGYSKVKTLLNSGNAVFVAMRAPSRKHASAIASAIENELKLRVPVVVKSSAEFWAAIKEYPFADEDLDPSRVLVIFAQEARMLAKSVPSQDTGSESEMFVVGKHAAFLSCPDGILESRIATALVSKKSGPVTTRNWATTLRLHALLAERER